MSDKKAGRETNARHGVHMNEDVVFVSLTRGHEAIVDAAVWPRIVDEFGARWFSNSNGYSGVYARKQIIGPDGTTQPLTLARAVTGAGAGERVEVINHRTLDCRRSNLRVVSPKKAAEERRRYAIKRAAEVRP